MSVMESPKLMIDLKFRHCFSEVATTTVVSKVISKKVLSFLERWETKDAMEEE